MTAARVGPGPVPPSRSFAASGGGSNSSASGGRIDLAGHGQGGALALHRAGRRALARLRPDLVRYVPFAGASHTREWNRDAARYEAGLARWLGELLGLAEVPVEEDLPVRDPAAAAPDDIERRSPSRRR